MEVLLKMGKSKELLQTSRMTDEEINFWYGRSGVFNSRNLFTELLLTTFIKKKKKIELVLTSELEHYLYNGELMSYIFSSTRCRM